MEFYLAKSLATLDLSALFILQMVKAGKGTFSIFSVVVSMVVTTGEDCQSLYNWDAPIMQNEKDPPIHNSQRILKTR